MEHLLSTNHFYKGRFLECREYLKGERLRAYLTDFNKKRIYVGNIPEEVNEIELYQIFSKFGKVKRAYIGNHTDKEEKIFGFVIMENEADVQKILQKKLVIKGAEVEIKRSNFQKSKRSEKESTKITPDDSPRLAPEKCTQILGQKTKYPKDKNTKVC